MCYRLTLYLCLKMLTRILVLCFKYRIWQNFRVGKLSWLGYKIAICGKTFAVAACRLTLPIDKAIICGKTFVIE